MPRKTKLEKQFAAHEKAAQKALDNGKTGRDVGIAGLVGELEFLLGGKFK